MVKSKEDLKAVFVTGYTPTQQDFSDLIDGSEGPIGPTGAAGSTGTKGATGNAGKDGFGTEEQYNAIISRLDALELV